MYIVKTISMFVLEKISVAEFLIVQLSPSSFIRVGGAKGNRAYVLSESSDYGVE
ncbi:hypothetical protein EUX98_g6298 [Antrodiella citrinella]|uniref:Uncharacterized protein n=1 Tax=Antrodiella citrinella TaxID=2447956 RepID=A0A4S4MPG4_9APHY|nr:hypothetical protein EUX98_g6298 [Antrodiella citrinella]